MTVGQSTPEDVAKDSDKFLKSAGFDVDLPIIGRLRECQRLYDGWQAGGPMLVCGPHGIGKTRLLQTLKADLAAEGAPVMYVRFIQPPHDFLVSFAQSLFGGQSIAHANETSITLRGTLWKRLEERPCTVLLDDIANAGPHMYRFFERILAIPGTKLVGGAVQQHCVGSLHRIFWDQRHLISLKALTRSESEQLADVAIGSFIPAIEDRLSFRDQVLKAARGNPGRIIRMCRLAADPAYRSAGRIHFAALNIDSLIT